MQLTLEQALQQAVAAHEGGNLSEAERIYQAILQSQPKHPDANHNLGVIAVSVNHIEKAVSLFKSAVDSNPDIEQFWFSYVDALVKAGRLKDAKQAIKKAKKKGFNAKKLGKLLSQPKRLIEGDAEVHFNLGNRFKGMGDLTEAESCYNQAIALKPDFAEAHNNLGNTLKAMGKLTEAESSFNQAIAFKPELAEAHNNLGNTLERLGRLTEAASSYNQAVALKPKLAEAHNNLGNTLEGMGSLTEAAASYNQAILLKPNYAEAHKNLGVVLERLGRLTEAASSYNQAIALKPEFAEAYVQLSQLRTFEKKDELFSKMLDLHREDNLSRMQRSHLNFGLAKAYEDLKDFEKAFKHYVEGNELRKASSHYDISHDAKLFSKIESSYPRIEQCSVESNKFQKSISPIFIVGMPRSGTTLVEQIVCSHSLVTGAGELPYVSLLGSAIATGASDIRHDALLNFRDAYLDKLKDFSEGKPFVTDKMPHNFRYLGLLARAFPEAKFVHVNRRPEAICWGNFKTNFTADNLGYTWALDDIVAYYKLYQSLMDFWGSKLKRRIYNLSYELLTDDQERETRRLIDFLGLEWDENCLYPEDNIRNISTASSLQVRQKVYRGSSDRWRNYEPFLDGSFDCL